MPVSSQGQFAWCDLRTTDAAAAAAFYRAVIGWSAHDAGTLQMAYTILNAGDLGVAGLMEMPVSDREPGWQPGWVGHIAVDDVDGFAARVRQAGGTVRRAARDIDAVGRFAGVADPQGARFELFTPLGGGEPPPAAGATPGRVGWHELRATDPEAAFAFYAGLFGWTRTDAIDMGAMGIYQTFATGGQAGDAMVGGMMTTTDAVPAPAWLYYFNVDDAGAAVGRVKDAGGHVLHGPTQVPGGSWVVQCLDPQGAMFAMIAPSFAR